MFYGFFSHLIIYYNASKIAQGPSVLSHTLTLPMLKCYSFVHTVCISFIVANSDLLKDIWAVLGMEQTKYKLGKKLSLISIPEWNELDLNMFTIKNKQKTVSLYLYIFCSLQGGGGHKRSPSNETVVVP